MNAASLQNHIQVEAAMINHSGEGATQTAHAREISLAIFAVIQKAARELAAGQR